MTASWHRSRSLRAYLLNLVIVAICPLIAFTIVLIVTLLHHQQTTAERVLVETARALAIATDSRIDAEIERLEVLATSPALSADDPTAFHDEAARMAKAGHLDNIEVIDPSGRIVMSVGQPGGTANLPSLADRQYFRDVLKTGKPAVSDVVTEAAIGHPAVIVGVPVTIHGRLRYVLAATPPIQAVLKILAQERIPSSWVATIMDRGGTYIARTVDPAMAIGRAASPMFRARAARSAEDTVETTNSAGEKIYDGFSHTTSGWIVSITVPSSIVEAPYRRMLWTTGVGSLLFVLGSAGLAAGWSRGISRPLGRLASAAEAVGRGGHIGFQASYIPEIDAVAEALVVASEQRDRAEKERTALLAGEQSARAAAEAANRSKDQFLAVLSHELRTPINAVYGWARLLQDDEGGVEHRPRALEAIVRNSRAQIRLIDDLLDVSRVINGKMRLQLGTVDVRALIEAALDTVRPAAAAKGLGIESVFDPRVGTITADPHRLQQVVWNLLINAVKFTQKGGRVRIHLYRTDSYVEIVVGDTGAGIPPQLLPFVFDRFTQGDSSNTREHGGLGLGLSLVKYLVELHGGTVAAESAGQGKGATFTVTLPLTLSASASGV